MNNWIDVTGFEGIYQVNSQGEIKSMKRVKTFKRVYLGKEYTQSQELPEKIMKQGTSIDGYKYVKLQKDGLSIQCMVSRIVYCSFNKLPVFFDGTKVICHKNDTPSDNRLDNLFIGTQEDNIRDCITKGRRNLPQGENNHNAKLSNSQVIEIKKRLCLGDRMYLIAKDFMVSSGVILCIREGITYKSITI